MTDPVNRIILLVDIEKFSHRDDVEQAYLRRMLYDVVDRTLARAGIDETARLRADQGDSLMEFIDPNASVTQLLRALVTEAPSLLRSFNRTASRSAQIRLRGVLAAGYIARDEHDIWVGTDLNNACRLLDADLLREALSERADDFALCVSESIYSGIVRHNHHGIVAEDFHAVSMASKNGPLPAWLHGPVPHGAAAQAAAEAGGAADPADAADPQTPARDAPGERPEPEETRTASGPGTGVGPDRSVVFDFGGGSPVFGGSLVGGDQHGVSGGQVSGDVHMGGVDRGEDR